MGRISNSDEGLRFRPEFAEALGRTIKVLRTDRGLERRELAERVGISYSYLTEIENGNKPPSSAVLGQIAEVLGLRMSQLIDAAETRLESRGLESQRMDRLDARMGVVAPEPGEPPVSWSIPETLGLEASLVRQLASQAGRAVELDRRQLPQETPPARSARLRQQDYALRPSLRGPNRGMRAALIELEHLLRMLAPEDVERLLDFARRLAR